MRNIIDTTDINNYIKDIRKIPLITHQRQDEIFKELKSDKLQKERKEKLHQELILGNLRFVISIAKSYQNQGLELMDLVSEGNIGLIKAAEKFDPNNGVRFISYAVHWIRQSIMASLNDNARTIRLPSNIVLEIQKQIKNDVDESELSTKNNPNLPYCIGLFNEINEDGDTLIELIPNNEPNSLDNFINSPEELKKKVDTMLNVLDEREKTIIVKYYGLLGTESNLEDLGEEFGCTKERIRQLRDVAIKKLRNESFHLLNYL